MGVKSTTTGTIGVIGWTMTVTARTPGPKCSLRKAGRRLPSPAARIVASWRENGWGPWSGEIFNEAGDVDIDHHVPLGHAHESGGWRWDDDRKRAFANDLTQPASLQVTKASLNRQKGKQPPDEWRPDDRRGWCGYAADWIVVKSRWDLTVTEAESTSLREMLETCGFDDSWGLAGQHPE